MDTVKSMPKQYLIVGGVIIALIIVIGFMMYGGNTKEQAEKKETVFEQPADVIPTVDSSVEVTIDGNTEAIIEISGVPDGTTEIEYELSYNTASGTIEGVFGAIDVEDGSSSVEEEITFGTCSSGVCRYHEIDGEISGTFKFSGSYGQKLLEQDFEV